MLVKSISSYKNMMRQVWVHIEIFWSQTLVFSANLSTVQDIIEIFSQPLEETNMSLFLHLISSQEISFVNFLHGLSACLDEQHSKSRIKLEYSYVQSRGKTGFILGIMGCCSVNILRAHSNEVWAVTEMTEWQFSTDMRKTSEVTKKWICGLDNTRFLPCSFASNTHTWAQTGRNTLRM